jgi:hypothetical protein
MRRRWYQYAYFLVALDQTAMHAVGVVVLCASCRSSAGKHLGGVNEQAKRAITVSSDSRTAAPQELVDGRDVSRAGKESATGLFEQELAGKRTVVHQAPYPCYI